MNLKRLAAWAERFTTNVLSRAAETFELADRRSRGVLGILATALRTFGDTHASDGAAGLAYYALFAIFPLTLFLVVAASLILDSEYAFQQTVVLVGQILPEAGQLIEGNLRQVMRLRGPVGFVSLAGLLWSGLGIFRVLADHVNRAWPRAGRRGYLGESALALKMAGALFLLLGLSLASTGIAGLLPRIQMSPERTVFFDSVIWSAVSGVVPWLLTFLMYLALYRWVPNARVSWRSAAWGAAVAALAWQTAIRGFSWFLGSSLGRYELVYGSLGTVIGLLFWVYLSSLITLFGAHLVAAIGEAREKAASLRPARPAGDMQA